MNAEQYRYTFAAGVPLDDVKESLMLAALATECLEGRSDVRLNASFRMEPEDRICVIDSSTEVGRKIAQIFAGFLAHEFGDDAFRVERLVGPEGTNQGKEDVDVTD